MMISEIHFEKNAPSVRRLQCFRGPEDPRSPRVCSHRRTCGSLRVRGQSCSQGQLRKRKASCNPSIPWKPLWFSSKLGEHFTFIWFLYSFNLNWVWNSVQDERNKVASVIREATPSGSDRVDGEKQEKNFGLTTPRNWGLAEEPVLNKRLGVYQRPMSAHGIRNQQVF